jgi:hypothetical protein
MYEEQKPDVSFFDEPESPDSIIDKKYRNLLASSNDYSLDIDLFLPLGYIKDQFLSVQSDLASLKRDLEQLLSNIYIKTSINEKINEAHKKVWEEVSKQNNINEQPPSYISFSEYKYAERTMITSCRKLVNEFHKAIGQSYFSGIYDLRRLIYYMQNEALCIRDILINKYGEDYEDDSQKQIALQFDAWTKMASHFAQRVRQSLISTPEEIPASELDKVTKKQAIEFQAFFSIRLSAIHDESQNILNFLKRDYVDNCDIFYERYLLQSMNFKKDIVSPMEIDFFTTSFSRNMPVLSEELITARNVINSNFGMIISDLIQRNQIISSNVDSLFKLIETKKKYSNYIIQLSLVGQSKPIIVAAIKKDDYAGIFNNTTLNYNIESELLSNHASLDNLDQDHHPQYLLKNGGVITGDISVESNVKIDGVHLSTHSHSGSDGSERIRATDIDYDSARSEQRPERPSLIEVVQYSVDILDGGVPSIDGIIDIEVNDSLINESNEIIIEVIEI